MSPATVGKDEPSPPSEFPPLLQEIWNYTRDLNRILDYINDMIERVEV